MVTLVWRGGRVRGSGGGGGTPPPPSSCGARPFQYVPRGGGGPWLSRRLPPQRLLRLERPRGQVQAPGHLRRRRPLPEPLERVGVVRPVDARHLLRVPQRDPLGPGARGAVVEDRGGVHHAARGRLAGHAAAGGGAGQQRAPEVVQPPPDAAVVLEVLPHLQWHAGGMWGGGGGGGGGAGMR